MNQFYGLYNVEDTMRYENQWKEIASKFGLPSHRHFDFQALRKGYSKTAQYPKLSGTQLLAHLLHCEVE